MTMSYKLKGITITFDHNMNEEQADALINAIKMFFKNNMYLMTDETIEMLANKRKNEYDIPENYTNIIGYKEISRILYEYSNS